MCPEIDGDTQNASDLAHAMVDLYQGIRSPDYYEQIKQTMESYFNDEPTASELIALENYSELGRSQLETSKHLPPQGNLCHVVHISDLETASNPVETGKLRRILDGIHGGDLISLRHWVTQGAHAEGTAGTIFRAECEAGTLGLYLLRQSSSGNGFDIYHVEGGVQENIESILRDSFAITHSEMEIIRGLLRGKSLNQLAQNSSKSVETVRSQFKSLASKLGVSRQQDLLVFMHNIIQLGDGVGRAAAPADDGFFKLSDGRILEYDILGDPQGIPIVFFHDYGNGRRWPADVVEFMHLRGVCVYSISRAGFGKSSKLKLTGLQLLDQHVDDYLEFMDRHKIERAGFLAFGTGFAIAYRLAMKHPERAFHIVGADAFPPLLDHTSIRKMSRGFFQASVLAAKYAPKTHVLISRIGAKRAMAIRSGADVVKVINAEVNLSAVELEDIYQSVLRHNIADLIYAEFDGSWHDCTFVIVDWADRDRQDIIRPYATIMSHGDVPIMSVDMYRQFADEYGMDFVLMNEPYRFHYPDGARYIDRLLEHGDN